MTAQTKMNASQSLQPGATSGRDERDRHGDPLVATLNVDASILTISLHLNFSDLFASLLRDVCTHKMTSLDLHLVTPSARPVVGLRL